MNKPITDAINRLVQQEILTLPKNRIVLHSMNHFPWIILTSEEQWRLVLSEAYPGIKDDTINLIAHTVSGNAFHRIKELDLAFCSFILVFIDFDNSMHLAVADNYEECQIMVKHRHRPDEPTGMRLLDIISYGKSIEYDLADPVPPVSENHTRRPARIKLTHGCRTIQDESEGSYDARGYIRSMLDQTITINTIGPSFDACNAIYNALVIAGFNPKIRNEGTFEFHPESPAPKNDGQTVALIINNDPMGG